MTEADTTMLCEWEFQFNGMYDHYHFGTSTMPCKAMAHSPQVSFKRGISGEAQDIGRQIILEHPNWHLKWCEEALDHWRDYPVSNREGQSIQLHCSILYMIHLSWIRLDHTPTLTTLDAQFSCQWYLKIEHWFFLVEVHQESESQFRVWNTSRGTPTIQAWLTFHMILPLRILVLDHDSESG